MAGTRAPWATLPAVTASSLSSGTRGHGRVPLPLTWARGRGQPGRHCIPEVGWGWGQWHSQLGVWVVLPAHPPWMAQQQPQEGLREGEAGWDFAEGPLGGRDSGTRAQYSRQSLVPSRRCGMCGAGMFSQNLTPVPSAPKNQWQLWNPVAPVQYLVPAGQCPVLVTLPGGHSLTRGPFSLACTSNWCWDLVPTACTGHCQCTAPSTAALHPVPVPCPWYWCPGPAAMTCSWCWCPSTDAAALCLVLLPCATTPCHCAVPSAR